MADLLIRNARIWAGRSAPSDATAALVRDGRFAFVGREEDINAPSGTRVLDMRGRFVMPGFGDSHVHVLWTGFAMQTVDLKEVPSIEEALRRVAERVRATPAGQWVTGAGWDQNAWPGARFPTREQLDTVAPEHPVLMTHTSGHCTWVNSAALRAAGVDRTTESPVGGAVEADTEGEPTGILLDKASDLVRNVMPHPTQTERIAAAQATIAHAHSLGLTTVHAMNVGRGEFQALHALNDSGRLSLRTRMYLSHDLLDEWIERGIAAGDGDDMLRVSGVKFFADGALGSLTAWMLEPYATKDDVGFPLQAIEDLERDVRRCLEAGLAPAIHAIGDRANREVLDLYERLRDVAPELPRRIEHAQLLTKSDIGRFSGDRVIASMQPIHATADWQKVDREWGKRGQWAYAFASLQRTGALLAFGSDSPVESIDPLAGVQAAITRQTAKGEPTTGWYPDERLGVEDALHHYTAGVAEAASESDVLGAIRVGAHADFVVLNSDPREMDWTSEKPVLLATFVGGETVFERDATDVM